MSQGHHWVCDACGRSSHEAAPQGWGKLRTTTRNGLAVEQDICMGCIARMHGWNDPYVVGTGLRLSEGAPGPMLKRRPVAVTEAL